MAKSINSIDQTGHRVELNFPPQRIISLVPSQTELLFDLGLNEQVVGVTRFCIHPKEGVMTKQKIGGTKRFDMDKIAALQPDLIIGNKEENYREGIEELRKEYPVWMSEIYTLEDAYVMMKHIAGITNRTEKGEELIAELRAAFAAWQPVHNLSVAYFIWRKPYMAAAAGTFIDHMLGVFGVKNAFGHLSRYPEIEPLVLKELKPDVIFLSSEPYSFSEKHFHEFREFSPGSKVIVVDGEMFSWYGSRLKLAPQYFEKLKNMLSG